MGTRSHIAFYSEKEQKLTDYEALLYRHYDGYPTGMLPDLFPVLVDFENNRGLSDTEYGSAWVVAKLKTDYLNVGISKAIHGDIEYFYAVYPNRLEVYKAPFNFDNESEETHISKFKLLGSLPYSDELSDKKMETMNML